ncbi:hypothetical protein I3843_05G106700 [Carya illinoinensis]|nr:hypothetical protein I3843_05G106700 [Carya illinoinensis]
MHSIFTNSTIYPLRSKNTPFSFNDYSYFSNERYDRVPSRSPSCRGCCRCYAFSTQAVVPTSPSFLYGLRQSTLIQWSLSRRLILGGGDRYYYGLPVYGLERRCYGRSRALKKRSVCNGSRRINGRFSCMISEEENEMHHRGHFDDVESLLSLLSEEVGAESFGDVGRSGYSCKRVEVGKRASLGGRERNSSSSRRAEVAEGGNSGGRERYVRSSKRGDALKVGNINRGERNVSSSKQVELEERESYGSECYSGKKNAASLELHSRHELQTVPIKSRQEDCAQDEEWGTFSKNENHRRRKGGSSSSYYSFSSLGGFESDMEVQDKQGRFMEESSSVYRDSGNSGNNKFEAEMEVGIEYKMHQDDAEAQGGIPQQRNAAVRNGVELEWRKKSEKKLTEISVEATESRNESSQMHSPVSRTYGRNHGKTSSSHKKIEDEEENLKLMVNMDKETGKQYGQTENQAFGAYKPRRKYQQHTEFPEFPASDVETTSLQKRNFHQLTEMSEIEDVNAERTSYWPRQSDTRMNNQEENSNLVVSSIQQKEKRHLQTGEWISEQIDSGRKSQKVAGISEFHKGNIERASITQTETRLKNKRENSDLVSTLSPEVKWPHPKTNKQAPQRIQSQKGSEDDTRISVVQASDTEAIADRRTFEKSNLTSLTKPVEETRERHDQTDEMVKQIKSMREGQRPSKLPTFHEETLGEASSFPVAVNLVSQGQVQQIDVEEDKSSSEALLVPPPSQLVSRGSLHVEMTRGNATLEVSGETSESGSSAYYTGSGGIVSALQHESYGKDESTETYGEPLNFITPEDTLGSADRLEKSSVHHVDEFVEKVRHEVLTTQIQKEKKVSEMKLASGEYLGSSSQFVSEDSQLKQHGSRRSSGGSGTKGPSDEMWDVMDSSVQQTSPAEGPQETTTTGDAIVKRTGRSLWGIIADVIRLRWVSHSESTNLVTRSGGRSSSYKSAGSETWFSGREHEENNDENTKREKRSMPPEVFPSDRKLCGTTSIEPQGEASDTMGSKDKFSYLEADNSSSLTISESGSVSKGISLASGNENLGFNEDTKGLHGTHSSIEEVGLSLSSPSGGIRRPPIVAAFSETGVTAASGSASMDQRKELVSVRLTEISGTERKDGELKQRKLQRKEQIPRDRFDEWEEAYKLESEQRRMDEMFMREALLEAKKAAASWEVPVGAVLVQHGKIIGRGCNLVEELRDSTAHAEMICIREASNVLRTWRLAETTLYVTLEPCPMCAGAILQARVNTLVWGAPNKLLGADGSWIRLFPDGGEGGNVSELSDKPAAPVHPFHPKMTIRRGVLASECADVMQQFFQLRRKKKKKEESPPPSAQLSGSHHPAKFLTKMHDIFHVFCL